MTYTEADLLPISALQHLLFCERQCALIHVERVWVENRFTAEGQILHRKAHTGKPKTRDGVRITRGLPLHSFTLGLSGQADVVEWRPPAGITDRQADRTLSEFLHADRSRSLTGWTVTPIEYKRGKPKSNDCDRVQLCAQAICIEEMNGVEIKEGQIFYGKHRRRFDVPFDNELRETTRLTAVRLHAMLTQGVTPLAVREKKCDTCSLISVCLPDVTNNGRSASRFFQRQLAASLASNGDEAFENPNNEDNER